MTPDRLKPYKMSFSTGGLFLNESIVVAGLHVPGEPWSVATTFDGYPMAQEGKAGEALTHRAVKGQRPLKDRHCRCRG